MKSVEKKKKKGMFKFEKKKKKGWGKREVFSGGVEWRVEKGQKESLKRKKKEVDCE